MYLLPTLHLNFICWDKCMINQSNYPISLPNSAWFPPPIHAKAYLFFFFYLAWRQHYTETLTAYWTLCISMQYWKSQISWMEWIKGSTTYNNKEEQYYCDMAVQSNMRQTIRIRSSGIILTYTYSMCDF